MDSDSIPQGKSIPKIDSFVNGDEMQKEGQNSFQRVPAPFSCDNYDVDQIRKISQALISGLATVCVESTYGDLFKTPASVVIPIRTDMVEYLRQESATYPTVFALHSEMAGSPENPADVVDDIIENFAQSKRNLFTRVSGWLLSEQREEKIDDFEEELNASGFWMKSRRESLAKGLLKSIDLSKAYHCGMTFESFKDLESHKAKCALRGMQCENLGCMEVFCATDAASHDAVCPLKPIPCEQKCPAVLLRNDMDRHCLTECPMRLVNCPFYQIGCQSTVPQASMREHCAEYLRSHLFYVLQIVKKQESSEDLTEHVILLEKCLSPDERLGAQDIASLRLAIQKHEVEAMPPKET